jgi:hypothetical protein
MPKVFFELFDSYPTWVVSRNAFFLLGKEEEKKKDWNLSLINSCFYGSICHYSSIT